MHDIQERDLEDYLNSYTIAKSPPRQQINIRLQPSQPTNQNPAEPTAGSRQTPMDLWMGFVSNRNIRTQRILSTSSRRGSGIRTTRASITVFNSGILSSDHQQQAEPTARGQQQQQQQSNNENPNLQPNGDSENGLEEGCCKIVQNLPRLTHYMEEPNAGKGFIKEMCFSADGRIICSPCLAGVRLFSFNVDCNELSVCVPDEPQKLNTVAHFKDYHPEIVVSCKFNPYHSLLVSGCLGGQIVWYHPVF